MSEITLSPHHAARVVELSGQTQVVIEGWAKWMSKYYSDEAICKMRELIRLRKSGIKILISKSGEPDSICRVCLDTVRYPQCNNSNGGSQHDDIEAMCRYSLQEGQVI